MCLRVFVAELDSYLSLDPKDDLQELEALLSENPIAGDPIPELKGRFYKIRLRNTDLRKGKRAGYRVVYYLAKEIETVFLVTMYVKGEKEDIRSKDILAIMKQENIGILRSSAWNGKG